MTDNSSLEPESHSLTSIVRSLWKKIKRYEKLIALSLLVLLIVSYTVVFSVYSILLHETFYTQAFDLGIFDQAIWLVSQGKTPFITVRGLHRFGDHVEFILYLLAPVYWIWNDVKAILILQSLALALGALPVYWIARDKLRSVWLALAVATSYLLYPALQNLNLDHAHAEAFVTTFLLYAFYAMTRSRYVLYGAFCLLALLCKEDVGITVFALGLYVAARHSLRLGLITSGISLGWVLISMKVILPSFNEYGFWRFSQGWFSGFYENMFRPSWYLAMLGQKENLQYFFHLLAPVGFLSLLALPIFLVATPAILVNILSGTGYLRSIDYHYNTSIIPFIFIATIYALARLKQPLSLRLLLPTAVPGPRQSTQVVLLALKPRTLTLTGLKNWSIFILLTAAIWGNVTLSHLPLQSLSHRVAERKALLSSNAVQLKRGAIAMVPKDAPVSADYLMVPHLSHREKIYMFPNPFITESWGVRDENPHDPTPIQYILVSRETLSPQKEALLQKLVMAGLFEDIYHTGETRLLKRVSTVAREPSFPPVRLQGHGLKAEFFQFPKPLGALPQSLGIPPDLVAVVPNLEFPPTEGPFVSTSGFATPFRDHFLAVFSGYLKVEQAGEYQFVVASDDGFRLTVNGLVIAEYPGIRAFDTTTGRATLTPGWVPMRLEYFENEGTAGLVVSYAPPGRPPVVIPAEVLRPQLP